MSERTQIDRLLEDVLSCAPEERDAFLDAACEGNDALRREVASLLAQASRAPSFLEQPATVPSLIGRTLGPYRIDAPIGAGGMGEVYRARDTKLGRDVAIKILPAFMAQDPDRLARLGREARALAALNHPHIGSIYGLEESDGIRGLVLELVDGDTLADRIARGPLAIGEALRIAGQIAEALAAAHAKGIVHRDLKPANIKITSAGGVKVLDFGLAKADADQSDATTLATREGTVMGTPAYMSPEQARGEAVDPQTDIWAFGCVLYEMLTRRRAFGGATASDCIAAILKAEPDWLPLPSATPAAVRTLLERCLAKDRARRLHAVADAHFDLGGTGSTTASPPGTSRSRPAWWMWPLAGALGLAVGLAGYLYGRPDEVATPFGTYNVDLALPDDTVPWAGLAISPDGRAVAASVSSRGGGSGIHLVIQYFDQLIGWQRVPGGQTGEYPFWSPDGKHLAFFADGKLLSVDPPNGVPVVICVATEGRGGVWLEDGTIVFADKEGPLMRVAAQGRSVPAVFVALEEGQRSLRFPAPAGPGRLLFMAGYKNANPSDLRAISLNAPQRPVKVMETSRSAVYERGQLFYERDGVIIRQRFDPVTNELLGEPVRVTRDAPATPGHTGYLSLSAAAGHVAVATIPPLLRQLVWIGRDERSLGDFGDTIDQQTPDVSPDGKHLAIARTEPGQSNLNLWIANTETEVSRQVTKGVLDQLPVWSLDSRRVAYTSAVGMGNVLKAVNVEGLTTETPLVERSGNLRAVGWIADGRFVWSADSSLGGDRNEIGIFISAVNAGPREPGVPFLVGEPISEARLSADGKHIAYTSSRTGRPEVYVDTFPTPAVRPQQISRNGGRLPRWREDSGELYFVANQDLMAVKLSAGVKTPLHAPASLFKLPSRSFAVNPDGSKFLTVVPKTSPSPSLKLTLNWFASQATSR